MQRDGGRGHLERLHGDRGGVCQVPARKPRVLRGVKKMNAGDYVIPGIRGSPTRSTTRTSSRTTCTYSRAAGSIPSRSRTPNQPNTTLSGTPKWATTTCSYEGEPSEAHAGEAVIADALSPLGHLPPAPSSRCGQLHLGWFAVCAHLPWVRPADRQLAAGSTSGGQAPSRGTSGRFRQRPCQPRRTVRR
jgi:hypothetical protein